MANKKSLLGGVTLKVENVSGFDKSRFNAFTAPLGSIVPMAKQLCLPGSFDLSVKLSAQLPPLASDAFLRSHLKVEAFFIPLRLCYGGFQSWFSGEKIVVDDSVFPYSTGRAELPRLRVYATDLNQSVTQSRMNRMFGVHTLMDYFGVKWPLSGGVPDITKWPWATSAGVSSPVAQAFNIFPFIAYQLCYHHWYRNKLVQLPLFAPPSVQLTTPNHVSTLPYISSASILDYNYDMDSGADDLDMINGTLITLRHRNYGFDYFTTALPSAQDGSPMSVDTSSGSFTISALRMSNALQHFAEVNQIAGPDYIQVTRARYGRAPSAQVAQRPILIGSADFPMFTAGVEQSGPNAQSGTGNPFAGIAARYGRAHAEGQDFVCHLEVDEPGYLMVMCSLVPEANYSMGIPHDMRIFTRAGSLVDLPCHELEYMGYEPVYDEELGWPSPSLGVFGYQPRYMWHKAGQMNEVHGLFREGASLSSFIPQRSTPFAQISNNFLVVKATDLDNVMAVSGSLSQYGVMIDSSIQLRVSEPLGESVLPSLTDPAEEHGRSVYLYRGANNPVV